MLQAFFYRYSMLSILLILSIEPFALAVKPVWRTPVTNVKKNATSRTQRASNSAPTDRYLGYSAAKETPYYTRPEDFKIPDYRPPKPNGLQPVIPQSFQTRVQPSLLLNQQNPNRLQQQLPPQLSQNFLPPTEGNNFVIQPPPQQAFQNQDRPLVPAGVVVPTNQQGIAPVNNNKPSYNPTTAAPYWEAPGPIPPQGAYGPTTTTPPTSPPTRPSVNPQNFHGTVPMQPSVSPDLATPPAGEYERPVELIEGLSTKGWYNPTSRTSRTGKEDVQVMHAYTEFSSMTSTFVPALNPYSNTETPPKAMITRARTTGQPTTRATTAEVARSSQTWGPVPPHVMPSNSLAESAVHTPSLPPIVWTTSVPRSFSSQTVNFPSPTSSLPQTASPRYDEGSPTPRSRPSEFMEGPSTPFNFPEGFHGKSESTQDRSPTSPVKLTSELERINEIGISQPATPEEYQPPGHLPEDFTQHIDVRFLKPNRSCSGPLCGIDNDKVSVYKPDTGEGGHRPTLLISNAAKGDAARLGYIPPRPKPISEFTSQQRSTEYFSHDFSPGPYQPELVPIGPHVFVPPQNFPAPPPPTLVQPAVLTMEYTAASFSPTAKTLPTEFPYDYSSRTTTRAVPSTYFELTTAYPNTLPPFEFTQPTVNIAVEATTKVRQEAPETTAPPTTDEATLTPWSYEGDTEGTFAPWSPTYKTVAPPFISTTATKVPGTYSSTSIKTTQARITPLLTTAATTIYVPVQVETTLRPWVSEYATAGGPGASTSPPTIPRLTDYLSTATTGGPYSSATVRAPFSTASVEHYIPSSAATPPPEDVPTFYGEISYTPSSEAPARPEEETPLSYRPTTPPVRPYSSATKAVPPSTTSKTNVPNRIRGKVLVNCKEEGIEFSANTLFPFTGQIFANDRKRVPSCLHNLVDTVNPQVFFPFADCGVKNAGELSDNRAQYHMQVVVVIQQNDGSSAVQSFMAQCVHQKVHYNKQTLPRRIEEALEELRLVATKLEQKAPLPQVEMKVVVEMSVLTDVSVDDRVMIGKQYQNFEILLLARGRSAKGMIVVDEHHHLGPEVSEVDIGMPLAVQWKLIPESDAYGFHVRNCVVRDDISGIEHKMIDDLGCSTDLSIFAHPHYDTYHDTASSHLWAFKVPDHSRLRIRCDVAICSDIPSSTTNMSSCASIPTPPFCPDLITSPANSILYDAEGAFVKRRRHAGREETQTVRATICTGTHCNSEPLGYDKHCFDLHWVAASTGFSFASLFAAILIHTAVKMKIARQ